MRPKLMTALFTALMILTCIALAGAEQLRWRVNLTVDSIEGKVPGISIGDQFVAGFEVESSLFDLPDGLQYGRFVNFDLTIEEVNWNESQPHSSPQFLLSPSGIDAFSVILTTTLPAHPDLSFFLPESPARWEVKDENDLTGKPIFGGDFGGTYTVKPILAVSKKNYIPPEPEILAELDELKVYISNLPDSELNRGIRKSLSQQLNAVENAYVKGNPCTAVNILGGYLSHASALIKGKNVQVAEDLRNRGWLLRNNLLLNLPEGERCKGFEDLDRAPEVRIKTSDNQHFSASVSFGLPVLGSVNAGGETWTQLAIPGLQSHVGEPGMPAIPTWHVLVAVPKGAEIKVNMVAPQVREEILANLYPFQEQAVDGLAIDQDFEFVDPPFVKNEDLYEMNAFYPTDPCSVEVVGNIRDLNVAQLTCVGGHYNPVTKVLQLYGDIDFELLFEGGDGMFITDRSLSPFETASKSNLEVVINRTAVQQYIDPVDISQLVPYGEELLILTHPDFREAADDLAQWKRDKGIITTVTEVGSGTTYDTGDKIDGMIEWRYDNCVVRPSYILLMGDVEYIPPAKTDYVTRPDETTGSDYGYAIYPQSIFDLFPDFAVGRISVDTLVEAQLVVDKIVQYESDPPYIDSFSGAPFYTTAANAAQFQGYRMNPDGSPLNCLFGIAQRSFTETSELVRDEMVASGYTVERIYTATEDGGGYCLNNSNPCNNIQQPYTGLAIPNRYYNGSLLPADLRLGSGFTWDGNTADIVNAFNEGRFLILHRDHGGNSGFGHPSFRTWDFVDLENAELLPVVYSVNCSSGYFDHETNSPGSTTESFMELLLLEEDGGMVGGLGDNRNSPTWENSALTRGFYDATWTAVAPEFGNNTSIHRLGDILNHGKMYLVSQVGVGQTAGSINVYKTLDELIIWHVYGDPTLEMWTANPYKMLLSGDCFFERVADGLEVSYEINGAVITAFQVTEEGDTVPIGRSVVKNEVAEIPFFHPPIAGVPIVLSASLKNAVSVLLTPVSSLPDLVIEQIAEESIITVSPGDDLTDLLKIKVGNLGEGDAPGTVNPDGTTKEGYMIDLVLSRDTTMPEGWAQLPDSPGETFEEDGLLQEGRVSRTPDVPAASSVELSTDSPINSDIGGIIPTQTPPGIYYLGARIDPGNKVEESDEDNNVSWLQVEVITGGPSSVVTTKNIK